ncbi:MAG: DUF2029 domain-containing protein [Deltaproteobacteria bacterium]|nr:DUF2029 domain-containing protein [Deltaproteobacteria bacterium]
MSKASLFLRSAIVLLAVGFVVVIAARSAAPLFERGERFRDFRQFWGANQVIQQGGDPYDAPTQERVQRPKFQERALTPFVPPWTLALGSAIATTDFAESVARVTIGGLALILFSALLTSHGLGLSLRFGPLEIVLAVVLSFPVTHTIATGQITALNALAFAALLMALRSGRSFHIGLAATLCLFKPHIFLIALAVIALRDPRMLIGLVVGGFGLLAAAVLSYPPLVNGWIAAQLAGGSDEVLSNKSETIVTLIRETLHGAPAWPVAAVPILGLLYAALTTKKLSDPREFLRLAFISVLFAPYGWAYDQTALIAGPIIAVHFLLKGGTPPRHLAIAVGYLFAAHILPFLLMGRSTYYATLAFLPPLAGLIMLRMLWDELAPERGEIAAVG